MTDFVTLAHGAGGKQTAELIDRVFKSHFANPNFTGDDAAVLPAPQGKIAMTTDGFIVSPRFFPGGNIGKLAICGTVNDLTCMGAKPLYMTSAFVIEEGFPMDELEEIVAAMEKTAAEVGVQIVAGDTKVAGKGQVDGVFINTTGVGQIMEGIRTSGTLAKPGDVIITTGDVGRHGCTILLARDEYGIEADECLRSIPYGMPPAEESARFYMRSRSRAMWESVWMLPAFRWNRKSAEYAGCWGWSRCISPVRERWS